MPPPEGVAVAIPSHEPLQLTLFPEAVTVIMTTGLIVTVSVLVQPLTSVTVTEQVPMQSPTAVEVVCPSHHKKV